MNFEEAAKVEITAIHDIDGPGLDDQIVEDIDIVNVSGGYDHHRGNVAVQIQKGVHFYGALPFPELGPGKQRQTKIDGCRIQDINGLFQFDAEGIGGVKFSGLSDEDFGKVGIDTPISELIGVRQGIAGDLAPYAQMIQFGLGGPQTGLDVPQAFPVGKLGESHAKELVPAGEALDLVVAVVPIDAFAKLV